MTIKVIEIRDAGTFIPAMALRIFPRCEQERYLIGRAGFALDRASLMRTVLLLRFNPEQMQYDAYNWEGGSRTMQAAHRYVIEHFDELHSGDVIDVEFILGISAAPKVSERVGEAKQ